MKDRAQREAYWREHVSAWRGSGLSQKAYCAAHSLSIHSLKYWQQRRNSAQPTVRASGSEAQLTLVAGMIQSPPEAPTPSLSIAGPNGWRLEFSELPPASWLSALCNGAR